MKDSPYNCPNCGAPIGYSTKCEYCGTVLRWIPTVLVEVERPEIETIKSETIIPNELLLKDVIKLAPLEHKVRQHLIRQMESKLIECATFRVAESYRMNEIRVRARLRVVRDGGR